MSKDFDLDTAYYLKMVKDFETKSHPLVIEDLIKDKYNKYRNDNRHFLLELLDNLEIYYKEKYNKHFVENLAQLDELRHIEEFSDEQLETDRIQLVFAFNLLMEMIYENERSTIASANSLIDSKQETKDNISHSKSFRLKLSDHQLVLLYDWLVKEEDGIIYLDGSLENFLSIFGEMELNSIKRIKWVPALDQGRNHIKPLLYLLKEICPDDFIIKPQKILLNKLNKCFKTSNGKFISEGALKRSRGDLKKYDLAKSNDLTTIKLENKLKELR